MMLKKIAILTTISCLSLSAAAQTPAERPSGAQGGAGPVRPAGRAGAAKFMERGEKDLPDALAFFREHSPKLAAAYDKLPEEKQKEFRPMIMGRYFAFKMAGADGAELKALKVRQLEAEDRLFDLKNRLIDAQEINAPEAEPLKVELRRAVADLIDVKLEERRQRIQRLEKLLSEEHADLEKDQGRKAEMIEKRYEEVLEARRADAIGGRYGRGDGERPKRPDGERPKHPDNKPK